jgi:hypothetical protein
MKAQSTIDSRERRFIMMATVCYFGTTAR